MERKIILASTSPRRKELLAEAGIEFEAVASDYEEDMTLPLPTAELVKHLSRGKAQAVANKYPEAIIIGADTIVVYERKMIGKPHTAEKARETLTMLNGMQHSIITGFTIIDTKIGKSISEAVETKVYFKKMSDAEIDAYIATGEPLDKAGAYGIQARGKMLVDHIEGDFNNVVGLPVTEICKKLREFGAL
jgi:septum formation protein